MLTKRRRWMCAFPLAAIAMALVVLAVGCGPDGDHGPGPAACGDGRCDDGESHATCVEDCADAASRCGDGRCDEDESPATCGEDCADAASRCGDGKCDAGESPPTCPEDCDAEPLCGDGACQAGETAAGCPDDCQPHLPECGDSECEEPFESALSCPADCVSPPCQDGRCDPGERAETCYEDCGVCGDEVCVLPVEGVYGCAECCGDGECSPGEQHATCPRDCGLCGDGVRTPDEECDGGGETATCDGDCTAVRCGDGHENGAAREQCDLGDGNRDDPGAACRADCTPQRCGDGITDPDADEQCDFGDGNSDAPDAACRRDCTPRRCGDGIIDPEAGERCEAGDTEECVGIDPEMYRRGTATCAPDTCVWDLGPCLTCGDGLVTPPEVCELGDERPCADVSELPDGVARCAAGCLGWDASRCSDCGNGVVEPGEGCDSPPVDCTTLSAGWVAGTATCEDCGGWDDSGCRGCGDGVLDEGEQCDGGTRACVDIDARWLAGTANCGADCRWSPRSCRDWVCGNGAVEPSGEVCEQGDSIACTALDDDWQGGTATCHPSCTRWDTTACHRCGNGRTDEGEACDGPRSCRGLGFDFGDATCSGDCRSRDDSACGVLDFSDDDIWRDPATGYVWHKGPEDTEGWEANPTSFRGVQGRCRYLGAGGSDEWRMATFDEIMTLLRPRDALAGCGIDADCLPDCPAEECSGAQVEGCAWPAEMRACPRVYYGGNLREPYFIIARETAIIHEDQTDNLIDEDRDLLAFFFLGMPAIQIRRISDQHPNFHMLPLCIHADPVPPLCGDGAVDGDEECEGDASSLCRQEGIPTTGPNSRVECVPDTCRWDTGQCSVCGDGVWADHEECELGETLSCDQLNSWRYGDYMPGTDAPCADCNWWDWQGCRPWCGNGEVDRGHGEVCEAGMTLPCLELGFPEGQARCSGCRWDLDGCSGPFAPGCGDGVVRQDEVCERGQTRSCASLGLVGGDALCNAVCSGWDTTRCSCPPGTFPETVGGRCVGRPASCPGDWVVCNCPEFHQTWCHPNCDSPANPGTYCSGRPVEGCP